MSQGNYNTLVTSDYSTNGLNCPFCMKQTQSVQKKTAGSVTWMWCCCLLVFTGLFCCVPFCVDSCKDTEIVCAMCQGTKSKIEANCC